METKYSVEITGSALSFLYFSASSSSSINEGFVLGTTEEKQTTFISDSDESGTKRDVLIRNYHEPDLPPRVPLGVTGIFPCGDLRKSIYHHCDGTLNRETIQSLLPVEPQDYPKKVVGWFSCRKNSQFIPSFRETALHAQLSQENSPENTRNFVLVLVRSIFNGSTVVREFSSNFFHLSDDGRKLNLLSGSILNWSKRSPGSNKMPYQSLPTIEPKILSIHAEKCQSQGLTGSDLVIGIINANQLMTRQCLSRIAGLAADIDRLNADIDVLRRSSRGGSTKAEGTLASDEEIPPSPPIGRRRPHDRVDLPRREEQTANMPARQPESRSDCEQGDTGENPSLCRSGKQSQEH